MARKLTRAKAAELYEALAEKTDDPKTELNYTDPYTLVVAVALSAQATDVGVNRATAKLFKIANTPEEMVALGEEEVGNYIKTIGFGFGEDIANVVCNSLLFFFQPLDALNHRTQLCHSDPMARAFGALRVGSV